MRIPCSTYRLQFHSGFTFRHAMLLVEYLHQLGISDIYASPVFKARKGSLHGYDVVDPNVLNPELGTEEELRELRRKFDEYGIGWLQDIVPNHMAFDTDNRMLMDVLEKGTASQYFHFFDFDWDHACESMRNRLLAPFLGKSYGQSLEDGEIRIIYTQDGFMVNYYALSFPLRIESYSRILSLHLEELKEQLGNEDPSVIKLVGMLYVIRSFPCQGVEGERSEQTRFIKGILWEFYNRNPAIKNHIDRNLEDINGLGSDTSRSILDELLFDQFYRLSFWKVASEEINYRRFFSINELISIRIEDFDVFHQCHYLISRFTREGIFTGLRIDHIDGLFHPLQYLQRLQESVQDSYTVVEKILAPDEDLPPHWPVQGTSGYDFMYHLNGIFCRTGNEKALDRIYTSFTGHRVHQEELLYEKKRLIVERFMTGDVDNLAHLMKRISSRDRGGCDITLYGLRRAIHEVLAHFPVYRTYISPESFTELDKHYIRQALDLAIKRNPDLVYELNYLGKFLLIQFHDYLSEKEKEEWYHFVMKFQQFTGPLMAKGFEDTILYIYNRLISLNEVGGDPFAFGVSRGRFHHFIHRRAANMPHSMNATSTHDTKRGEDVRARIHVLSEIPGEWEARVRFWRETNRKYRKRPDGSAVPSRNDEYFFYQTIVGACPFDSAEWSSFVQRIREYMNKSIREAKVHTGWIKRDEGYETAFDSFIDRVLDPSNSIFLDDFLAFQRKVAYYGMLNSLSQVLIKSTCPGVPDFYQGTELWEFSLVDPDNRRPVDFRKRTRYVMRMQRDGCSIPFIQKLLKTYPDGRIKLFLTYKVLKARREHPILFQDGEYLPLETRGRYGNHIIAFARRRNHSWALTIAPRFWTDMVREGQPPLGQDVWADTEIRLPQDAPSAWRDVITGESAFGGPNLLAGDVLRHFPVSLLLHP